MTPCTPPSRSCEIGTLSGPPCSLDAPAAPGSSSGSSRRRRRHYRYSCGAFRRRLAPTGARTSNYRPPRRPHVDPLRQLSVFGAISPAPGSSTPFPPTPISSPAASPSRGGASTDIRRRRAASDQRPRRRPIAPRPPASRRIPPRRTTHEGGTPRRATPDLRPRDPAPRQQPPRSGAGRTIPPGPQPRAHDATARHMAFLHDGALRYDDMLEGQLDDILCFDCYLDVSVLGSKTDRRLAGQPATMPRSTEPTLGAAGLLQSARFGMHRLLEIPAQVLTAIALHNCNQLPGSERRPPPHGERGPRHLARRHPRTRGSALRGWHRSPQPSCVRAMALRRS